MGAIADGFLAYRDGFASGLEPDPDMWIDEWADQYMVIPKKSGAAEPGHYNGARTPYAAEVARCLSPGHPCRTVVVMGASQMLKTQTGLNFIAAGIHQAPANMLVLLPTLGITKRVSARIAATIDAVPVLKARVAPPRSRDSRNTVDTKEFDGGTLYVTTAGSASNLAEIPARYVWGDEVDRWADSVDGEGDPVDLADARRSTFEYNSKGYYTSSPTIKHQSRIAKLYRQGDQRRYHVPCPHCDHRQPLEWEGLHADEALTRAWYVCCECGCEIEEGAKTQMLAGGHWQATAPGDGLTVSFQLSALYMPLGWTSWLALMRQYRKAKAALDRGDHGPMQVFYNTRLALEYDTSVAMVRADVLQARAEPYALRSIAAGVLVLTASVDVQPSRLEVTVMGWGAGMERWVVDHQVLWGAPSEDAVWQELERILLAPLINAAGLPMTIAATCIDSGGHNTQDVYNFCRPRKHRKVVAIKGASRPGRPVIASKPALMDLNWRGRSERQGVELWHVGTDTAKDWIAHRWLLAEGPGAIHFSRDLPDEYYTQLTAERRIVKYRKGHQYSEWVKGNGERNEALDLCVYNLAAANLLGLHKKQPHEWARMASVLYPPTRDLFAAQPNAEPAPAEIVIPKPAPAVRKRSIASDAWSSRL
ncbi:phage terminase large subunit family protein [Niveibacterium sp. SC-1]|uniref:phage terminase large subunit family protein n=1 Tax=Niveibacterium sp. SC-1 TaxID=3135646 RepID=UPI00311FA2D2